MLNIFHSLFDSVREIKTNCFKQVKYNDVDIDVDVKVFSRTREWISIQIYIIIIFRRPGEMLVCLHYCHHKKLKGKI